MQHFMIPCDFGGRKAPFPIYVGEPKADSHPLHYQSWWLSSERGGSIPQEVMDSFEKLHKIAIENNVSFEELCVYAMGEALGEQPQQVEAGTGGMPIAPPPPAEEEEQQMAAPVAQPQPAAPQAQPQQFSEQQQQPSSHQERVETNQQATQQNPHQQNQS